MMWPLLTIVAAACAIVIYWRSCKNLRQLESEHVRERAIATEQQRNAERLQAQQNALFNSMTEGLLVLDAANHIQITNRALHQFFNIDNGLTGKTVLEAFRLHSIAEVVEMLKREPQVLDYEVELPGWQSRWLQVNASTIRDERGERLGAVLIFHDVTRLKKLEDTRRDFVANVSHELRTPLSMIKGFSETLLSGAIHDPEVSTRFVETIERHADRLARLIDDLLCISELESGRMTLNLASVNVSELVGKVISDLSALAETAGVTLTNNTKADTVVEADPDRLRQVLWNLVENAIKYGNRNGKVTISCDLNGDQATISVRDNGPGIPPDSLARIFERFYRLEKDRSREKGGTGLGLSIVKHIVQSHGGKVWAESKLGEGTTFFASFKVGSRG